MNDEQRVSAAPVGQLRTDRSLLKLLLLSLITCGIYSLIVWYTITEDINAIASRYDGKRTMNYILMVFIIAPITLGIGYFVWEHRLCNRMGSELSRRNIDYAISAADFWLWGILGGLIIIGPFVFLHKQLTAMNLLAEHYNVNG